MELQRAWEQGEHKSTGGELQTKSIFASVLSGLVSQNRDVPPSLSAVYNVWGELERQLSTSTVIGSTFSLEICM